MDSTVVVWAVEPLTFRVRSASRRGLFHYVFYDRQARSFSCDCEAAAYRDEVCLHVWEVIRYVRRGA